MAMRVLIQMLDLELEKGAPLRDFKDLVAFLAQMVLSTFHRQVNKLIQRSCLRHSSVEEVLVDVEIVDRGRDRIFKCMSV
jgi:hypothetical protein